MVSALSTHPSFREWIKWKKWIQLDAIRVSSPSTIRDRTTVRLLFAEIEHKDKDVHTPEKQDLLETEIVNQDWFQIGWVL